MLYWFVSEPIGVVKFLLIAVLVIGFLWLLRSIRNSALRGPARMRRFTVRSRIFCAIILASPLNQTCFAMAPDYVGVGNLILFGLGLLALVVLGIIAFIALALKRRWGHVKVSLGTGLAIAVLAELLMHSPIAQMCAHPYAYPQCESDWYFQVFFVPLVAGTFLCSLAAWTHSISHPQEDSVAKQESA